MIDTATNSVIGNPIAVGTWPAGVAVNPAGTRAYVANVGSATVSVIRTDTNTVVETPSPWAFSEGVAFNSSGTRAYVTNMDSDTVSVINTATNAVIGNPIAVGSAPWGIALGPS